MRIVVFSDSHRNFDVLHKIVCSQPDAEVFIHLGDGEREFEEIKMAFPDKRMYGVCGNNDWGSQQKDFDVIVCAHKRIFFTHGHLFGVKVDLDNLLNTAKNYGADIVQYGHTHISHTDYIDGLHILNPGSVSLPQAGPPSYGIVDITSAGIVTSIVFLSADRWI